MTGYGAAPAPDPFAASRTAFEDLASALAGDQATALTHDGLEELVDTRGLALLRQLLQDHYDLRANREEAAAGRAKERLRVVGPDGRVRPWLERGHTRQLVGLFGRVTVCRVAWRGRGVSNVHPADVALSMPSGRHSRPLARLAVRECVRGSFDQALAAIERRCGKVVGKRRLRQMIVEAAGDVDAFYAARIPLPVTREMPLVLQVDQKGVVMRPEALREATRRAAAKAAASGRRGRLCPGEKPNRKRMATVACVFDVHPAPRRPHDVIGPPEGRSGERVPRPRPRARNKWLTASLVRPPEHVIADAFEQATSRDPHRLRDWVVLVDGARHQLDLITAEAQRRHAAVHVLLDVVHVSEYLWTAAHAFYPVGSAEAEQWVADKLTAILSGHAARVAREMTAQADAARLPAPRREPITACTRYLTGHLDQLDYPTALARGWPIATGAVEGACRHLIADRLGLTGCHWGLAGAEAVLQLRAIEANDDLDPYWEFHAAREHERLYPTPDQHNYGLTV